MIGEILRIYPRYHTKTSQKVTDSEAGDIHPLKAVIPSYGVMRRTTLWARG